MKLATRDTVCQEREPPQGPRPVRTGMPRHPDLFTAEEAAAYLGLEGPRSIQRLRQQGRIEPVDLGRRNLYHRADLDALVDSLARRGDAKPNPTRHLPEASRSNESPQKKLASPGRERKLCLKR